MLDAISSTLTVTPPGFESLFVFPILLVAAESSSSVTGGGSSVLVMLSKHLYALPYRKTGTKYFFKESRSHRFGDREGSRSEFHQDQSLWSAARVSLNRPYQFFPGVVLHFFNCLAEKRSFFVSTVLALFLGSRNYSKLFLRVRCKSGGVRRHVHRSASM